MKDIGTVFLTIFGAIVGLAILSTIVGQKSTAPAAIQAAGTALAKVVAAAVNPVTTASTNGNLGASTYTSPANTPSNVAPFGLSGFLNSLTWPDTNTMSANSSIFQSLGAQ